MKPFNSSPVLTVRRVVAEMLCELFYDTLCGTQRATIEAPFAPFIRPLPADLLERAIVYGTANPVLKAIRLAIAVPGLLTAFGSMMRNRGLRESLADIQRFRYRISAVRRNKRNTQTEPVHPCRRPAKAHTEGRSTFSDGYSKNNRPACYRVRRWDRFIRGLFLAASDAPNSSSHDDDAGNGPHLVSFRNTHRS